MQRGQVEWKTIRNLLIALAIITIIMGLYYQVQEPAEAGLRQLWNAL